MKPPACRNFAVSNNTQPPTQGDLRESHAWDDVDQVYRVSRFEHQPNGLVTKVYAPPTWMNPNGIWTSTEYDCEIRKPT